MKTKFSVHRVAVLWESRSNQSNYGPKAIAIELSKMLGYNPISVTLLAQQSGNDRVRSESIQAYYFLMEEEMLRKSVDLYAQAKI